MARNNRSSHRRGRRLAVECLEPRMFLSASPHTAHPPTRMVSATPHFVPFSLPMGLVTPPTPVITALQVQGLLDTAERASVHRDAIIAVVDRFGNILGVRVEPGVAISDQTTMVFAIDGAVSLARTAAFFANGGDPNVHSAAPITSRTVRFISQSTITEREVESSPDITDPNSPLSGPGYVAPIGLGNHFPAGVFNAPQVDLFGIEQTNRGLNIPAADLAAPGDVPNTDSYGVTSGLLPTAKSRGIATLPGGIPLFYTPPGSSLPLLVGGIGVFFPGSDGFATHEQSFQPVANPNDPNAEFQAENNRTNAPQVLEAEWMAFAAAGGITVTSKQLHALKHPIASVPGFGLPAGNLNLVGITLDVFGPKGPFQGLQTLVNTGKRVGAFTDPTTPQTSADVSNPSDPNALDAPGKYAPMGITPPSGWLVNPHGSAFAGGLTQAQVTQIIDQGVQAAMNGPIRAAIRLQTPTLQLSAQAEYVLAVADKDGSILGLYRMPDATIFSIDVAVAKARNTVYYASADFNPADMIYNYVGTTPVGPALVPAGVAFTNRTFRALAEPRFPGGIDGKPPGAFSSLHAPGIDPRTAENIGGMAGALPASMYSQTSTPLYMYTSFNAGSNFRADRTKFPNQNGVVWFPGSSPLYLGAGLPPAGGFGVSGDGVDQDDVATVAGQQGFAAPAKIRADQYLVHGVRLPYQKFNRNPNAL